MTISAFYRFITIAAILFGLSGCATRADSEPIVAAPDADKIRESVSTADALFRERANVDKLREAVKLLAGLRNPDVRNYEVEWKFAKFSYFLGRQIETENERESVFQEGEKAGRIASRIESEKPEGHFWYAANLGERAKISPVTVGVKSVDDIREAMNKVIAVDPTYQSASAFDALAQIELQTAGMMGGKPEKAVELIEKGLAIAKNNSYLHLRHGEALLATGNKAEAKKSLEQVLKITPDPEYLIEFKETSDKAKKLLETKF
jgi:tetratricopeptide (TPR) repeat protein